MSTEYAIAETDSFRKTVRKNKALGTLHTRIVEVVYPILRKEPHFGPNIKRLKGEFSDFYRYRMGDHRLFYTIDENEVIVVVVGIRTRAQNHMRA